MGEIRTLANIFLLVFLDDENFHIVGQIRIYLYDDDEYKIMKIIEIKLYLIIFARMYYCILDFHEQSLGSLNKRKKNNSDIRWRVIIISNYYKMRLHHRIWVVFSPT